MRLWHWSFHFRQEPPSWRRWKGLVSGRGWSSWDAEQRLGYSSWIKINWKQGGQGSEEPQTIEAKRDQGFGPPPLPLSLFLLAAANCFPPEMRFETPLNLIRKEKGENAKIQRHVLPKNGINGFHPSFSRTHLIFPNLSPHVSIFLLSKLIRSLKVNIDC